MVYTDKKCEDCGAVYKPRSPKQRHCQCCINKSGVKKKPEVDELESDIMKRYFGLALGWRKAQALADEAKEALDRFTKDKWLELKPVLGSLLSAAHEREAIEKKKVEDRIDRDKREEAVKDFKKLEVEASRDK